MAPPNNKKKDRSPTKVKLTHAERKAKYTAVARQRSQKKRTRLAHAQLVCFGCRQRGHALSDCPQAALRKNICYRCGSSEHALHACPEPASQELPFARCFVCGAMGHLASACQQNEKGIYIDGGECRYCGSKQHLASKCPSKPAKGDHDPKERREKGFEDVNVEDLLEPDTKKSKDKGKSLPPNKKKRAVKF